MTLNEYQEKTKETAVYPKQYIDPHYFDDGTGDER